MKTILIGLAASLTVSAGLAAAQDGVPMPRGGGMMMRADKNGDGVITRQEAIDEAAQRFDRMDLNHDGKLDQTELAQIGQRMREMRGMRGMGNGGDMPPPPPPAGAPAPRQ